MSERRAARGPGLRGSEGRILSLIGRHGTRPSVLADGAWISKQAIGKRIHDLAERGLVEVEPDPADGRAVLVRRTAAGDRLLAVANSWIADVERDLASVVGEDRYAVFRQVLDELASGYLPPSLETAPTPSGVVARRR